jgi:hypothetical protein
MDLHHIPIDQLLFHVILYGCLPLWLIMGCIDWYCHKASMIEKTTGVKESIYHIVMGAQIGVPVFLGLFFEINVLLLLIFLFMLILHEWCAHHDVKYALDTRKITMLETHVHSFMEVIPFVVVLLLVCMRWSAFVDLITLNWGGQLSFVLLNTPVDRTYIAGYVTFMLLADVVPYIGEFVRCVRYRKRVSATPAG